MVEMRQKYYCEWTFEGGLKDYRVLPNGYVRPLSKHRI